MYDDDGYQGFHRDDTDELEPMKGDQNVYHGLHKAPQVPNVWQMFWSGATASSPRPLTPKGPVVLLSLGGVFVTVALLLALIALIVPEPVVPHLAAVQQPSPTKTVIPGIPAPQVTTPQPSAKPSKTSVLAPTPAPVVGPTLVPSSSTSPTPTPTSTPTPTPSPTPSPSPSPTPSPTLSPSPTDTGTSLTVFLTGYSYWDNDPPGSAAISDPVIHQTAGGTGTYDDPVTLAVGFTSAGPDIAPGTKFYIPAIHRYAIVEDTCGACHEGNSGHTWIDVYVDGSGTSSNAAEDCMNEFTGTVTVIKDPGPDETVVAGPMSSAAGCRLT